jgi:hypothetical protein
MEISKGKWRSLTRVLRKPWEKFDSKEHLERTMWVKMPSRWFDDIIYHINCNGIWDTFVRIRFGHGNFRL